MSKSKKYSGLSVLVVQGEPHVRRGLERWLRAQGASVRGVSTIAEAKRLLETKPWDAVIVDRRLKDGDGFEAIVFTPSANTLPPRPGIVALSADFDPKTFVRIQSIGVVALPNSEALDRGTLAAAIELALQRARLAPPPYGRIGRYSLDVQNGRLVDGGNVIPLSGTELGLLIYLMHRSDAWVSASELSQHVLKRTDAPADVLVRQYIFRLRRKLGPDHRLIEHAYGRGYRALPKGAGLTN
jgi:DNA-binding response OmpR family regulator